MSPLLFNFISVNMISIFIEITYFRLGLHNTFGKQMICLPVLFNMEIYNFKIFFLQNNFLSHLNKAIRNIFVKKNMGFKHWHTLPWTLKNSHFQGDIFPYYTFFFSVLLLPIYDITIIFYVDEVYCNKVIVFNQPNIS